MSTILLAYQTLNDPVARQQYDLYRTDHLLGKRTSQGRSRQGTANRPRAASEVSPSARRDRQRYYDFPDLQDRFSARVDLIEIAYTLSPEEAHTLRGQGMLRGVALETEDARYYCHRCHHRWPVVSTGGRLQTPRSCPKCHTTDWAEYLLLRCVHCCAVFESEQIRYEIGIYKYGQGNDANLCPPYELFPLCPYCGTARWCPAEDVRVNDLRLRAARRAALFRIVWLSIVVVILVLLGVMALAMLK
jgi:hypothetical protein